MMNVALIVHAMISDVLAPAMTHVAKEHSASLEIMEQYVHVHREPLEIQQLLAVLTGIVVIGTVASISQTDVPVAMSSDSHDTGASLTITSHHFCNQKIDG